MSKRSSNNDMDFWVTKNLFPVQSPMEEIHETNSEILIDEIPTDDTYKTLKTRITKLERENLNLRKSKESIDNDNSTLRKLLGKIMETI